jgi:hypothetical protein
MKPLFNEQSPFDASRRLNSVRWYRIRDFAQRYEHTIHYMHFIIVPQLQSPVGAGGCGLGDVLNRQQADESSRQPHDGI